MAGEEWERDDQPRTGGAPTGTYHCWGDSEKLDVFLARLRERWGNALSFSSPTEARAAMDEADAGRLGRLLEEELAA